MSSRQAFFNTKRQLQGADFIVPTLFLLLLILNTLPFVPILKMDIDLGVYFVALFLWGRDSESFFAPFFVFLFGLLHDVLGGAPFGLWAASFCLFFGLTHNQSHILSTHNFYFGWMSFAIMLIIVYGSIFIIGLWHPNFSFPLETALINVGLSVLSYVIVAPILESLRGKFRRRERLNVQL